MFARRGPRYEITGRHRKSFLGIQLETYELEITRYEIEMDKDGPFLRFVPSPIALLIIEFYRDAQDGVFKVLE